MCVHNVSINNCVDRRTWSLSPFPPHSSCEAHFSTSHTALADNWENNWSQLPISGKPQSLHRHAAGLTTQKTFQVKGEEEEEDQTTSWQRGRQHEGLEKLTKNWWNMQATHWTEDSDVAPGIWTLFVLPVDHYLCPLFPGVHLRVAQNHRILKTI